MNARDMLAFAALATVVMTLMQIESTAACSCIPSHPQSHFCSSDYVILVRILRKSAQRIEGKEVYKIEVKRAHKIPKDTNILRDGRLMTSPMDSMCGVNLKVGKLYMIAGRNQNINICNYVKEYSQMTIVERRGFAGGYKKGCACEIKPMFRMEGFHHSIGTCYWKPFAKCETQYGACVPARGFSTIDKKPIKCHWRNSQPYAACRDQQFFERTKLK